MTDRARQYPLQRRQVVRDILSRRGDALVVGGLGASAWDITDAGDNPLNFPLWGAMGGAAAMGLGLALSQPDRRILVITGDGEMLMGLSSLATLAVAGAGNLCLVVLDNERYGETGMQVTHTAHDVDLAGIAKEAGFQFAAQVTNRTELESHFDTLYQTPGPVLLNIKVRAEDLPLVLPPKDGTWLKQRFRRALDINE